jgi:hypothetical protein
MVHRRRYLERDGRQHPNLISDGAARSLRSPILYGATGWSQRQVSLGRILDYCRHL